MYSVKCRLYTENCAVYHVQCTLYSVQCTMYSVQCIVYSVHYTLYPAPLPHCCRWDKLYTIHCKLCSVLCTAYSVHCTLYSVYCTMYSVKCIVYSVHYTLYPAPLPHYCRWDKVHFILLSEASGIILQYENSAARFAHICLFWAFSVVCNNVIVWCWNNKQAFCLS